ncbi:thiamine diphosphokinase [Yoonia maricola]|uniref:thiamine diphosphokinase n=1 Tax=Yoonia maricola TaxID=420999 RepID=UPI001FEC7E9A|nr:thiamine diphosphokinase [Yoonia maricola]
MAIWSQVEAFVGVDSGADHLLAASVTPAAVIGDLDSLSDHARTTFADILHEVPEQSTTDFEKALVRVAAPLIFGLGFTGARLDHTLSVLNVIAQYPQKAVILIDADDASFLARMGQTTFQAAQGTRVSIMPLGTATVTAAGLQWPFTRTVMTPNGFTSPSNVALGGKVTIETDGPVLITLPRALLSIAAQAAVRAG